MVTDQSAEKILYQSLSPYDDSMLSGMTVSVPLNTGFESPWQLQLVPHVNYFKRQHWPHLPDRTGSQKTHPGTG